MSVSDASAADGGLGRNAAVMAAGTAVSRVLGVVRSSLLVAVIATNSFPGNSFNLANTLPNVIYMLIAGGVLNAVLVPQVVRAYRSADGQQYVDRLLTLSGALLLGITAVLTVAAPLVVWLYNAQGDIRTLATLFAFWCIPQVFFYGVYTLLGQVLNARGNFGPYMWAPVFNNIVAIAGLLAFLSAFGKYTEGGPADDLAAWDSGRVTLLAGSATLGVVLQALVLLIPLYRSGFRYRPRWDWRGAGLGTAGRVAGWAFAALVVGQVAIYIVYRVSVGAANITAAGGAADVAANNAYSNAFMIFMLPHSLVTVSLLTALFTRLSDHAAARDTGAVRTDFSYGLRTVAVFTVFAAVALSVLALPLVRVIYPTNRPAESASLVPIIVAFMAGLVALGAWSLCQRVFYAYEDAKGLFRIQVIMAGVVVTGTLGGYLFAEPRWWVACAAASMSASYVVGAVWGGAQVWRRLGGGLSRIVRLHVRAGLAATAAAALGWLVSRMFGNLTGASFVKALAVCLVVGAVMLGTYLWLLRRLQVTELDDLLGPIVARLRRRLSTPALVAAREGLPEGEQPQQEARVVQAGEHGGDRLDTVIGRGTLLAGRYRLHQPVSTDLPGVESWTARDQILDRPVRALVVRSGNVAAAQDAARRAALVTDPRLLRVLDVGDHEGVAYTVTEPIVGQDLAQLTAHGPLSADQVRAIVGEAAAALEVARRRGVHHLALRPSAVHVTPDGAVLVSGLAMDGELIGYDERDAKATSRADTVGLVALLYLGLTGRWPDVPRLGPAAGATVAPAVGGNPVPPAELSPAVPNDLDTLCVVTLGLHDDGPHSPGELVRELEPWGPVDAQGIYDALDGVNRSVTIPSGPWSADGSAAGAAARSGLGGAAGAGALGAAPTVHPVQRQSVRRSFGQPSGTQVRPGTPPPATPPTPPAFRRPEPPAASSARGGATAVLGSMPASVPASVPPSLPPSVRPAAVRRLPDDFDDFISRSAESERKTINATPIVLGIVAVLVVIGLFWAFKALTAPAPPIGGPQGFDLTGNGDNTGADAADDPATAAPAVEDPAVDGPAVDPAAVPVIASAQMIDPPPGGDNNEHPEAVPLAIDGDPSTFWYTRTYASPTFGMKPGVGFAVTFAEPATVTTVTLLVNGTGGMVEVRATDPSTPTQGDVLASGALGPQTVLTLSAPTATQNIVLWFTALPQTPGALNRVELLEVQVS